MSTVPEIEAALPKLSAEELARVGAVLQRLRGGCQPDARFDGRTWPQTPQEIADELAEVDALPPLLSPEGAKRFDTWLAAQRERQQALGQRRGGRISKLFT
jgi:hypothetical protein